MPPSNASNKTLILEFTRGKYLDQHENIHFFGDPGTGMTHLATALGHAACAQGKKACFYCVIDLVSQLPEAREERVLQRMRTQLDDHHLLVLDEFVHVPFSKAGAKLRFDVVSRTYERLSLILTSNLPFEQWTKILGNERLTGALLDWLTHRVHILEANGESYRLNDSQK